RGRDRSGQRHHHARGRPDRDRRDHRHSDEVTRSATCSLSLCAARQPGRTAETHLQEKALGRQGKHRCEYCRKFGLLVHDPVDLLQGTTSVAGAGVTGSSTDQSKAVFYSGTSSTPLGSYAVAVTTRPERPIVVGASPLGTISSPETLILNGISITVSGDPASI